ncbi:uncharacterized protein LOC144608216 [Rhinoraja longicauda]
MAIGCGWAYRGRTKDIIIYGCSGDTAPIATDGTGRREAEETAVHFHEGRWPGWLGSNSSEYSSASGFAYRNTSLLCPRVKIIAQRVSATVGKRICLVCTGKVPTSRRWWLWKTSRTMANSTVEWERLNNNTHITISGTKEQLSVCWDKWWEPDEGIYMCMWGSRYRCPTGNSIFFQRQWQDDGKGMRCDVSSRACGVPLSPIPVNATELITRPRITPPTVPLAVAQEGECPKTTKGPGNGLVLLPTDQVLYQGVHYAVASVILNLTEVRLPGWCPRETERLYQVLLTNMFRQFYEFDLASVDKESLYSQELEDWGQTGRHRRGVVNDVFTGFNTGTSVVNALDTMELQTQINRLKSQLKGILTDENKVVGSELHEDQAMTLHLREIIAELDFTDLQRFVAHFGYAIPPLPEHLTTLLKAVAVSQRHFYTLEQKTVEIGSEILDIVIPPWWDLFTNIEVPSWVRIASHALVVVQAGIVLYLLCVKCKRGQHLNNRVYQGEWRDRYVRVGEQDPAASC